MKTTPAKARRRNRQIRAADIERSKVGLHAESRLRLSAKPQATLARWLSKIARWNHLPVVAGSQELQNVELHGIANIMNAAVAESDIDAVGERSQP